MAVSDKNVRTMITLPRELKVELEKMAKQDGRSLNNLMIKILTDYIRVISHK